MAWKYLYVSYFLIYYLWILALRPANECTYVVILQFCEISDVCLLKCYNNWLSCNNSELHVNFLFFIVSELSLFIIFYNNFILV